MNFSVVDAIASARGNVQDVSALLPHGIAPGAKTVMRRERDAAEYVSYS